MANLARFSLSNRALVALSTIIAVLAGLWATTSLRQELIPDLELPIVAAVTTMPGASPEIVEDQVTGVVEEAARGVPGLEGTTSQSGPSVSAVMLELEYGTDILTAQQELQVALGRVEQQLPEDAETQVIAGSVDDLPVIQLAATGGADVAELQQRVEEVLVPELSRVDGVRQVQLSGITEQRVAIDVDPEALAAEGLTLDSITSSLDENGVVTPAGTIESDGSELTIQAGGRLTSPEEIAGLPLVADSSSGGAAGGDAPADGGQAPADPGQAPTDPGQAPTDPGQAPTDPGQAPTDPGQAPTAGDGAEQAPQAPAPDEVVTIDDVADVAVEDVPATSLTRTDGVASIGLAITATPDGNTVEISEQIRELMPELEGSLGDGGELVVAFDQAVFIQQSIEDLAVEGVLGLAFAVLVILLFLRSIRATTVTAISIPLSLLVALLALKVADYSLNMFTLAALTISIGRVVDDSIVVIENIARHQSYGTSKRQSVLTGVKEVAGAVTSATVATAAVFVPLGLVGGMVGELLRPFAFTVALALGASLLVALTIVPVLAYWFLRTPVDPERAATARVEAEEKERRSILQRGYVSSLRGVLGHRWLTIGGAVVLMAATVFGATRLPTDFIGDTGENAISVTQDLPTGVTLEAQDAAAQQVEDVLADVEEVESYQVTVGSADPAMAAFGMAQDVTFSVTLDVDADAGAVEDDVRERLEALGEDAGTITVAPGSAGGFSSGVEVIVSGADGEDVAATAEEVEAAIAGIDGLRDVESSLASDLPFIQVAVDRPAAASLGLTESAVGGIAYAAINGLPAGDVDTEDGTLPIVLFSGEAPATVDELSALPLGGSPEAPLVLDDVADVAEERQQASITRQDGLRSASITAATEIADLQTVNAELATALDSVDEPEGVSVEIGGVSAEQEDAFGNLFLALGLAVALVYLVMVATFRSLVQPLVLLVSIPFAATGAILGLWLTDTPLGVAALVGALMLVGVVVTNAIVLIDLINQYRTAGMDLREAVVEGGRHRLRPILMTSAATIMALIPMAFGITGGGAFISQPLAIVVIGGLITSTILTLLLVPVLYELTEGRGERRAREKEIARLEKVVAAREERGEDAAAPRAELERLRAGGGAARVREEERVGDDDAPVLVHAGAGEAEAGAGAAGADAGSAPASGARAGEGRKPSDGSTSGAHAAAPPDDAHVLNEGDDSGGGKHAAD
ncbi:efflux RND transporter permease subunit [Georgenia sp. Z1344]|uniref:efflux RND transporter permease subunit n=1 Tax=Georgenia sp. Z1344 TaxID=3416706 RepID=UPI003CF77AB6